MIATTPDSKPIECTPAEELTVTAYSVLRQVRHYFAQLEPSHSLRADTQAAVRDVIRAFESKAKPRKDSPALTLVTAASPDVPRDVLLQGQEAAVLPSPRTPPLIPTTEF